MVWKALFYLGAKFHGNVQTKRFCVVSSVYYSNSFTWGWTGSSYWHRGALSLTLITRSDLIFPAMGSSGKITTEEGPLRDVGLWHLLLSMELSLSQSQVHEGGPRREGSWWLKGQVQPQFLSLLHSPLHGGGELMSTSDSSWPVWQVKVVARLTVAPVTTGMGNAWLGGWSHADRRGLWALPSHLKTWQWFPCVLSSLPWALVLPRAACWGEQCQRRAGRQDVFPEHYTYSQITLWNWVKPVSHSMPVLRER